MTEEQRIERIESYIDKSMPADERLSFEKELETDTDLRNEVEQHAVATEVIRYASQKELKQRLQKIDAESSGTGSRRRLLRQLAIAASFLVLVAVGAYFMTADSGSNHGQMSMTPVELASDYFSPATVSQLRGQQPGSGSFSSRLAYADQLFLEGKYSEAAKAYEELAKEDNPQQQKAEWNMILSRMANDDSRYLDDLKKISSDVTHSFNQKAIDLLKAINPQ